MRRPLALVFMLLGACRGPVSGTPPGPDASEGGTLDTFTDQPAPDALDGAVPSGPDVVTPAMDVIDPAMDVIAPSPDVQSTDAIDVARRDVVDVSAPRDVIAQDLVLGDVPRTPPFGVGTGLSPDAIPERRVTCDATTAARMPSVTAGASDRIVLRGRVIAATGVIPQGEVLMAVTGTGTSRIGRILCVAPSCANRREYAGATVVETAGVIAPGLVDAHNHPQYNFLPPWVPPRLFQNSDSWQGVAEYRAFTEPLRLNEGTYTCQMVKWGELRSIFAGTTTIQGGPNRTCVTRTLARNIEHGADFEGVDRHRPNTLGIATVSAMDAMDLRADMDSGALTAYILHLGEGINEPSRREFDLALQRNLVANGLVVIHGTALGAPEFQLMARGGARLVWSPRSNVILYGRTTDIGAALDAGLTVALAPDWTPSGGPNLLSEMRYARYISRAAFNNRLTDRDIVEMATRRAALAVDRPQVGELAEGRYADVLVVPDRGCDAYATVIDAPTADVRLVLLNGRPAYGDAALLRALPMVLQDRCEPVTTCGQAKTACVAQADTTNLLQQTVADIERDLRTFTTPYPLVPLCP